jgi:hypothetical protein
MLSRPIGDRRYMRCKFLSRKLGWGGVEIECVENISSVPNQTSHNWISIRKASIMKQFIWSNIRCHHLSLREPTPSRLGSLRGQYEVRYYFFSTLINDFYEYLSFSIIRLFADDSVIYKQIKSPDDFDE